MLYSAYLPFNVGLSLIQKSKMKFNYILSSFNSNIIIKYFVQRHLAHRIRWQHPVALIMKAYTIGVHAHQASKLSQIQSRCLKTTLWWFPPLHEKEGRLNIMHWLKIKDRRHLVVRYQPEGTYSLTNLIRVILFMWYKVMYWACLNIA